MRLLFAGILGAFLATLALEALFQFLPVDSGQRLQPTTADMPFMRALPRSPYVFSYGWAMTNARRGEVNQEGFNNSPDFADHAKVLIIGDSYIESSMLAYSDTVQGHLSRQLNGDAYAAAASGNGLADSLVLARYYAPRIHPRNIVFYIKQNDISEILLPPDRGHSGFRVDGNVVELTHTPYSELPSKQLVGKSALARYVYFNLKARVLLAPASGSNGNQIILPQSRLTATAHSPIISNNCNCSAASLRRTSFSWSMAHERKFMPAMVPRLRWTMTEIFL